MIPYKHLLSKKAQIICAFILLNLSIGLLFHRSLSVVCISELFIIAIFGLVFWNIVSVVMKSACRRVKFQLSGNNLLLHGGLGVSIALISIFLSHVVVVYSMILVYNCTHSPGFSLINTSLANNVVLNLLCYFGLALIYFRKSESHPNEKLENNIVPNKILNDPKKLFVDRHGTRKILPFEKINYIQTSNNCIVIYTDEGRFVRYQSLKKFIDELNYKPLQRIHKSYAVNTNKIVSIRNNKNGDGSMTLSNGDTIKFSRNYNVKRLLVNSCNH